MTEELLKLRAEDAEDIEVMSAVLQDSIVPQCDMAFQEDEQSFVLVAQRLCREKGRQGKERICCALTVKGVKSVRTHGMDHCKTQDDAMLDLLAIILEPSHVLNLIFAGDARIKVELDNWSATIEDYGPRWPSLCQPHHDAEA